MGYKDWPPRYKLYLFTGIGLAALAVVLFFVFVWDTSVVFDQSQVSVSISGPESVKSGNDVEYTITYRNESSETLVSPQIEVVYPTSFHFGESQLMSSDVDGKVFVVNDIGPGDEASFTVAGSISGDDGDIKTTVVNLLYNIGEQQFQNSGQMTLRITPSDLEIFIEAPQEAASGDEIVYLIKYSNLSRTEVMENVRFVAQYPVGFVFGGSVPAPSLRETVWDVGDLEPRLEGVIRVEGRLTGRANEAKLCVVEGGLVEALDAFVLQTTQDVNTRIVAQPLVLDQRVNGSDDLVAEAGDRLEFSILYQNAGDVPLPGTVVMAELNTDALDTTTVSVNQGGAYKDGVVTWTSGSVAGLAILSPGDSGELVFSATVKGDLKIGSAAEKNFFVRSQVSGTSGVDKYFGNVVEAKIQTLLSFEAVGRYFVGSTQVGSGPVPPKVGETTVYRIIWRLDNTTNDLANVRVSGALPTGVTYVGNESFNAGGSISFNPLSEKVVWDIGTLFAGVGSLTSQVEGSFDVSITPSENQIDSEVVLMHALEAIGIDSYVLGDIRAVADQIDTSIFGDPQKAGQGRVQP